MKYPSYLRRFIIFVMILSSLLPTLAQDNQPIRDIVTIVADDAAARFGLALAADGDLSVVGAPVSNENRGSAYVYQNQGNVSTQIARLAASDGEKGDGFGKAVAINGNTIIVGAPANDDAGGNAGAVYVFTNNGSDWVQTAKLLPSAMGDVFFGSTVAIDGNTIAVGAPFTDSGTTNSGAAYLFEATNGSWHETIRLATGRGGAVLSDLFGWAVALKGDLLVVGAYLDDAAYVYNRAAAGWEQSTILQSSSIRVNNRFGYSVATDGSRILVGATHDSDAGNRAGAAFVFASRDGSWEQEGKLIPTRPSPLTGSNFGWSVSIAGETLVVGAANSKGVIDAEESGAAYIYQLEGSGWRETTLFTAVNGAAFDHLGMSTAIGTNTILVGAPDADTNTGAVIYFSER